MFKRAYSNRSFFVFQFKMYYSMSDFKMDLCWGFALMIKLDIDNQLVR